MGCAALLSLARAAHGVDAIACLLAVADPDGAIRFLCQAGAIIFGQRVTFGCFPSLRAAPIKTADLGLPVLLRNCHAWPWSPLRATCIGCRINGAVLGYQQIIDKARRQAGAGGDERQFIRAGDHPPGPVVIRSIGHGDAVALRPHVNVSSFVECDGVRLVARQAVGSTRLTGTSPGVVAPGVFGFGVAGEAAIGADPDVAVGRTDLDGKNTFAQWPRERIGAERPPTTS